MGDQISESGVVEDAGRSVAHVEENLVKSPVREVAVNQFAQLLGIAERGEGSVD
jgi:hypothetical protein